MHPTKDAASIDWIHRDDHGGRVRAHAKLNVTLEVLDRNRAGDDYHNVMTIMQTIELHDVLSFTVLDGGSGGSELRFTCSSNDVEESANLAVKAAKLLKAHCRVTRRGAHIALDKRIPIRAGLGGGSSDAAAVLAALNELWQLSLSIPELTSLAASLGADVPFFLHGGLALCEGRGEIITPLPQREQADWHWPASMRWLVLVKPSIGVSTADAYQNLQPKYYSDGSHTRRVCTDSGKLDIEHLWNGMAESVYERYPEIARVRNQMLNAGAPRVELCGTGSTLFAPFYRQDEALRVKERLSTNANVESVHLTEAHKANRALT